MSVIAEFTIEAEEFLLGKLVAAHPTLTVELERVVPAAKRVMPYVWGYGDGLAEFEDHLSSAESVRTFEVLDRLDESALYKIQWEEPAEQLVTGIAETDATILRARGTDAWTFRIRFETHEGMSEFHEFCREHGITYQLSRVYALPDPVVGNPYGLTDAQYETLSTAVERGYFEVPREVTFAELAEDLGISEQAVSERVRRGANTVLTRTLLDERQRASNGR
ncbi:helix-turn-helix domain-containing protein [Halorientalis salina]|uniref:helix-turn-helix domain-containing protein n=1 Tax=Halorientalis salina TaxID=2932266 RepID=UPI0010AD2D74|nr:helix-turn-helix domain-containing protein [Halorientalis salina]